MVHGNRGRSPSHRIDEATRKRILSLAQTTYAGANYQHLRDLLEEREGIVVSRASVRRYGRPLAFYHDRHEIFPKRRGVQETDSLDEQLAGRVAPSQFGRLLEELEITSIAARSPQAKGRVERLFGTLQDRLVLELRLAGASTREQANEFLASYLPRFNAQFAVPAAQEGTAYRALPPQLKLEDLLCFKYERVVAADNTVQFGPQRIQVLASKQRGSYVRVTVEVHEHFDGSLTIHYAGQQLVATEAPPEAPKLRARGGRLHIPAAASSQTEPPTGERSTQAQRTPTSTPRDDHPWRKWTGPPEQAKSVASS